MRAVRRRRRLACVGAVAKGDPASEASSNSTLTYLPIVKVKINRGGLQEGQSLLIISRWASAGGPVAMRGYDTCRQESVSWGRSERLKHERGRAPDARPHTPRILVPNAGEGFGEGRCNLSSQRNPASAGANERAHSPSEGESYISQKKRDVACAVACPPPSRRHGKATPPLSENVKGLKNKSATSDSYLKKFKAHFLKEEIQAV